MTRDDDKVLDILEHGPRKHSEIVELTGLRASRVSYILTSLLKFRFIRIVSGGGTHWDPYFYALWEWQGPPKVKEYEMHIL